VPETPKASVGVGHTLKLWIFLGLAKTSVWLPHILGLVHTLRLALWRQGWKTPQGAQS